MRVSQYQKEIINLLKENHLLSIADIHKKISSANYSTIYRNIQRLVDEGIILKRIFGKNNVLYELALGDTLHGHFLCEKCNRIQKVAIPKTQEVLGDGYVIQEYLITGLCNACTVSR